MATPSKRRKTNNYKGSPQTLKSLDYFFGSQRAKQDEKLQPSNQDAGYLANGTAQEKHSNKSVILTDEQLARKLQEEWDAQERGVGSIESGEKLSQRDFESSDKKTIATKDAPSGPDGSSQDHYSTEALTTGSKHQSRKWSSPLPRTPLRCSHQLLQRMPYLRRYPSTKVP